MVLLQRQVQAVPQPSSAAHLTEVVSLYLLQVFFIVGEFALVIIAVALPSWRGQFAAGAVLCAASLLLWPLLPESGRWLYVQGRTEAAMEVSES
jgi:hypothetical protein